MPVRRQTPDTYVQKVAEETQRCLAELKSHNERLRLQSAALDSERSRLQQDKLRLQEQLMDAREEISRRHAEHDALIRRLKDVEHENERVAAQFLDIETQNTNLANLYVASYQLRSSLERADVLAAIREIIINLIGSEEFAVYERTNESDVLTLVDAFEADARIACHVRIGEGVIGTVAATGEAQVPADGSRIAGVTACIPLKVGDEVSGVVAVFRLLPQKSNVLESLDHELLDLLAAQAGVALHCSRLHEQARAQAAPAAERP